MIDEDRICPECGCDLDFSIEEREFTPKTRKARKTYECNLCSLPITKGETYLVKSGVVEGDVYNVKQHINCPQSIPEAVKQPIEIRQTF